MQFLSEKLSRHLSSLAPGFEGHWKYVRIIDTNLKTERIELCCIGEPLLKDEEAELICMAWQPEDVMKNSEKIIATNRGHFENIKHVYSSDICSNLAFYLNKYPDTAYQKIEGYLWTILKT